jgi:putative membrane protein insertion efficiency factor
MTYVFRFIWHIPRNIIIGCIRVYQYILSPDHSVWAKYMYGAGYCKFHPTCSMYGVEAIKKFGVIRGSMKTVWRILRCNPWSNGGNDPV